MNFFKTSKFFLMASVFALIIVFKGTVFPFIVSKYVWFRLAIDLALIFFLLGLLVQDKNSVLFDKFMALFRRPLVIAVSVFTAVFLLACLFGIDPSMSFWSNFERGEGGLQIIHLYLFFVLSLALFSSEKDWLKIFGIMLFVGFLSVLYGFFAGIGGLGFIGGEFGTPGFRFAGSIGNPAYLAAYMIFLLFYGGYILAEKYKGRLISIPAVSIMVLMIVFTVSFWGAKTRGAFIGLLASLVVFAVYVMFSRKDLRKWLLGSIVVLILAVSCLVYFKDSAFVKAIPGSRLFDISITTQTFEHRAIMWKTAIDGWKERPVFGWGPENYLQVFSRHFGINYFEPEQGFGAWFDRAHSVYFDYLVETGIVGLLSFLAIFFVLYWQIIAKRKTLSSLQGALLFAVPTAYLVQGIVLFDVLPIYMNLFLVLAFASHKLEGENKKNEKRN